MLETFIGVAILTSLFFVVKTVLGKNGSKSSSHTPMGGGSVDSGKSGNGDGSVGTPTAGENAE
jgi:hypothetical protein